MVPGSDHGSLHFAFSAGGTSSISFRQSFDTTFYSEMEGYITRVDIWAGHGEPYNYCVPVANHTIRQQPIAFQCHQEEAG